MAKATQISVVVDAKPAAVPFYERYGSESIDPGGVLQGAAGARPAPRPMFLALGSIPGP